MTADTDRARGVIAEVVETTAPHTLTGTFRRFARWTSRFVPGERDVLVYLPPGYDQDTGRRYPVLYLHDGQNVFDQATSIGEEWHVDETAEALISAGEIEPLVIVGVDHGGDARIDEFTPTRDAGHDRGGSADAYGRMLVEEIKPLIDATFRTLPGAGHTGVGGSSLGGLVTLHLGLRYPAVFSRLAVMSPSIWWDDRVILRTVASLPAKLPFRLWLDAGTEEGEAVVDDARALRDALVARGWVVGEDLVYHVAEGAAHHERAWAERVDPMLRFLAPRS